MEEIIEKRFVWVEHEDFGIMGWELVGCGPSYGSLSDGLALAHDVLEHFELNTVEDEIEAHAAMYWIRLETGTLLPNGRNLDLEAFSYEWTGLYNAACAEGSVESTDPQERLEDDIEADLDVIVTKGVESISDEMEDYLHDERLAELSANFRDWFRLGYRKTQERYARVGQYPTACMFTELTQAFEASLKGQNELYGGEELTVTVNLNTGVFSLDIEEE